MSNTDQTQKLTRQQLYDRIRETSKEEFILSEMIKLGFWPKEEEKPSVPTKIIQERGKLQKELNDLVAKQRKYKNRELLLKEIRTERMAAAKLRREETKQKREEERIKKAKAWAKKQEEDIVYLGKTVSKGLNNKEEKKEQLTKQQLPSFENIQALATAMNISLRELRFLAFARKTSTTSHYKRFYLPKKSGGKRLIAAPMPRLKSVQYWILENILYKIGIHDAANGFTINRSIVTNAEKHVNKEVVINLDLKNFFPSISYVRVRGLFRKLGYSEQVATILALLCTEPDVDEVVLDGTTYFIAKNTRHLPQGAPTSPAITNILCRKLDARLQGLANKKGFTYTRYADDLTFSASGKKILIGKLLKLVTKIVKKEGFTLHPDKLRIMRKANKQEVTGITVNEKLNVDRKTLKRFRALLFQIEKDGLAGKSWNNSTDLLKSIQGYANFVNMVNPEKGATLLTKVKMITAKYKHQIVSSQAPVEEVIVKPITPIVQEIEPTEEEPKTKPWWKLWD